MRPIQLAKYVLLGAMAVQAGYLAALGDLQRALAQDNSATLLTADGPIGPAASDYISRGLTRARDQTHQLVILTINTPGGLDTSTREIVRDIIASPVPVVCYVAPGGARAASAGTYILYACHFAAMAPGTNVGAATPIQIGGGFPGLPTDKGQDDKPDDDRPALEDKVISDSAAYIRSLAQMRDRNVEWAEKAVREAASIPAEEALKLQVIDILADDLTDLLDQLDGRSVKAAFGRTTLKTKGITVIPNEPDWRTRFLSVITNPNVAYILLLIGIYGLLLEFYGPGALIPGITGAICLLLGLYALNFLPVNYAGLALLGLGTTLMIAEAFAPAFGVLGIGGALAFVIGSVMLLETDAPGFVVSRVLIGSVAAVTSGLFLFFMLMLLRARRQRVATGLEEMVSNPAEVVDWSGTEGHIRIHGEIWKARSKDPMAVGVRVVVRSVDGLVLEVGPIKEKS